jgi:hypothetical protein
MRESLRVRLENLARFFLISFLLAGCGGDLFKSPLELAENVALQSNMEKQGFREEGFVITTFLRRSRQRDGILTVYVEGDGNAWLDRNRVSPDPTPLDPYTLRLAARHPPGNVLYIARPCQYLSEAELDNCHPKYWITHRYAANVVRAIGQAINRVKETINAKKIALVGYSGGGVIAALLAGTRQDVSTLTTIASNLDHELWTRRDKLTPLDGSLNPVDFVLDIQKVPQIHFAGARDEIVAPDIIRSFVSRMSNPRNTRVVVLENFDHDCCWVKHWPALLEKYKQR